MHVGEQAAGKTVSKKKIRHVGEQAAGKTVGHVGEHSEPGTDTAGQDSGTHMAVTMLTTRNDDYVIGEVIDSPAVPRRQPRLSIPASPNEAPPTVPGRRDTLGRPAKHTLSHTLFQHGTKIWI